MTALRRLAHSPAPRAILGEWRLELLAAAALVGGLVGMGLGI